ncbi:MAG: hypothetical protein NT144_05190 [Bacteroidia bacterium]|nr:hypothetical protein [Bacteroidia bacterium]
MFTFSKKFNTFEKKLYIPQFKIRFENKLVFSTIDILSFYREIEPDIPSTTVNWRVYKLVDNGIIVRIGRGKFKLGKGSFYFPEVDNRIIRINKFIKEKFPYIQYCIWGSYSMIEFGHHIPKTNIIFVDADRDSTESVYHSLKEEYRDVFYKPGKDLLSNYINDLKSVIIARPLVSEAPLQIIKNVPTITIEKLLVDALVDEEFGFLKGNEIIHVFENAFERYILNISKMIRYSDRKRKKPELLQILNNYNLAAYQDLLP